MKKEKKGNGKRIFGSAAAIMFLLLSLLSMLSPAAAAATTIDIGEVTDILPGESVTIPIMILNVTNVGVAAVNFSYDPSVVHVTAVTDSQFDICDPTINNVTGEFEIPAMQLMSDGLNGDVRLANVTLKAVGIAGQSSPLNITINELKDATGATQNIPADVDNGTFTIGGEAPLKVVINEFVSDNTTEWVELYNNGSSSVDLAGWTLEDEVGTSKSLSSLGTIGVGDYKVFTCVSGWLNNGGDVIWLNNSAAENVDRVGYGTSGDAPAPDAGKSTGRYPNGIDTGDDAADFREFEVPTPGAANVIPSPPPAPTTTANATELPDEPSPIPSGYELNWTTEDVVISFRRIDTGGSGVDYTNVSTSSETGPWTKVNATAVVGPDAGIVSAITEETFNVTVSDEGSTTIWYYSVDKNVTPNIETTKNLTVRITTGEPDLIVSKITPNCDYLFGNESNIINATIENTGAGVADAFNVSFVVDGVSEKVRVDNGLAAGENITIFVSDPTTRNAGESVTITVTADCDGEITESNETDNVSTLDTTVVNNGYKGKRYTGGDDITTMATLELNGNMTFSFGDSYYLSANDYPNWKTYNATWTATELTVPATATVVAASLNVPYTWDKADVMPNNVNLSFNGNQQTLEAHYTDRKGYGSYDYPYGVLVYDVSADFNTSGNIANLTNLHTDGGNVSIRGMALELVYADANEPLRKIIVNGGFDLLYGGSSKCTTPEEATAYVPFAGTIDTTKVVKATLVTFAPGAGNPAEGDLIFNDQVIATDAWEFVGTGTPTPQIGVNICDVTAHLSTTNEAGFRSDGDYMEASCAVLVLEIVEPENIVSIEDVTLAQSTSEDVPIRLLNSTGVGGGSVTLTFNPAIANVTNAVAGDFDSVFNVDYAELSNGSVLITAMKSGQDLTGDLTFATVTLQAVGSSGSCELGLSAELTDKSGVAVPASVDNGTFTILSVTTIDVSPPTKTLKVGDTQQFTATAYDQDGTEIPDVVFTWTSSDTNVGTIAATGLFTANASGTTTITATNGTVNGTASVTVYVPELITINVTPPTKDLKVGETQQFTATAYDQAGTEIPDVVFTWTSSDTNVGTIDAASGFFTAKAVGTTTIKAANGTVNGTATVTVELAPTPTPRRGGGAGGGGGRLDSDLDGYFDTDEIRAGTDPFDPCDPNPKCAACLALKEIVAEVLPTAAPTAAPPTAAAPTAAPPTAAPTTPPPTPVPGFEAVFAIAGLLAVAYLVLRRKK